MINKELNIETIVKSLPEKAGVYQFIDNNGTILYIGKAKNLKKRVSSYFQKEQTLNSKLKLLLRKIEDIKSIVVDNEFDALLLENTLIKKHQPRFNVNLKDDKTYPWICIKNERFPRVFSTRNVVNDGSKYFGPYASGKMMHTLLELIRQLYPLRSCNLNLSESSILKGQFSVCLEYHIKNCLGPCENLQSEDDYNFNIKNIEQIIKGNVTQVLKELKPLMWQYANDLKYEQAKVIKDKIEILEKYQSKSTVVNTNITNTDVFSIVVEENAAYINFLKVVNGAIIQSHNVELQKKLDETDEDLLLFAMTNIRERFNSDAKEIILPFNVELLLPKVSIVVPQRGDKKDLLSLSERNASNFRQEKLRQRSLLNPEKSIERILQQMQKDLRMNVLPKHIECFDNSNIQGAFPVAAMVVFKDTKPQKREYRHFNIKTVEGPNDFASMEEIVFRRYHRLLEEKKELPQLIVIDGGKGQLSAALKSLEKLNLRGKITIIGIAKKLEEIYFPNDSIPLYLDKKSETLRIIQQIRDEAHRFGITHHRERREKGTITSELLQIPDIGFKTAQKLLWKFKSVKNIKAATSDEIEKIIGKAKASLVFDYFQKQ